MRTDETRWRSYTRALAILDGSASGHALPIIRRLAHRAFAPAINVLSDYVPDAQAIALLRRATRLGDATSAYNLAITHRNRGDMLNYRRSLSIASTLSDEAAAELRQFKTRFPEEIMRRHRRKSSDRCYSKDI
jgi:hypothetical protein